MFRQLAIHRRMMLIGLATLLLILGAFLSGAFESLELKAIDAAFNGRGAIAPVAPIVIVAIDDESFNETGQHWPWSRAYFARLLDEVSLARPKLIGIDVAFYEAYEGDAEFADAIRRANNVVLANTITVIHDPRFKSEKLNWPIQVLARNATAVGLSNFPLDRDGFGRSILAYRIQDGQILYHWSVLIAARYLGAPLPSNPAPDRMQLGDRTVPLDDQSLLINFRGPPRTFKTIPAYRVVKGDVPLDTFKDSIVLIGATSVTLHDSYPTPFQDEMQAMPGVEMGANTIETIITGNYLNRWSGTAQLALLLVSGAVGWSLNLLRRPMLGILLVVGLMLSYAVAWAGAFAIGNLEIPLIGPETAVLFAFIAPTVERAASEEAEKRRVRRIFEQFISPEMVNQLVEQGVAASLGRRAELTILISDIRGFTTLSEKLSPDEVVSLLNEYLEVMTEVIFRNSGTVDKFEGDAIIAFWGAPHPDPEHAQHAVNAALEMRTELARLRAKWAERGNPRPIEIGIGLNTGQIFVGLIGSAKRVNYTVIGDNVNLTARLQELTKEYRWPILITESTQVQVRDTFDTEFLDSKLVRGKSIPVTIYRVLGKHGAPASESVRALYEETHSHS